jgi:hypothetical protein
VGRRRIGLELVEGFVADSRQEGVGPRRGNVQKQQEQIQDAIVERAKELHRDMGGNPFRARVSFGQTDFRKSEIEKAATTLVSLIPKSVSRAGSLGDEIGARRPLWLMDIYVSLGRSAFVIWHDGMRVMADSWRQARTNCRA